MTYDVTDAEKAQAEKALIAFNTALKLLNQASDHLNIMLTPFKDHPDISSDEIMNFRAALRRFRDKSIDNFNAFKIGAFKCITLMQMFSSDTQSAKLIKSFISSVEDIEKQVNKFSELFNNLESKDFVAQVVKIIEGIKKETDQLELLIDDRIKSHVQSNILGKTWVDGVSNELQMSIEKRTPLLIELNKERENELNNLSKERAKG